MFDRRSLRYWLGDAAKTFRGTLLGCVALWAACLLLAPARDTARLLSPAAAALFLLMMNGLVTMINVTMGCRVGIPLALSFGATRRDTFAGTRLIQLLPSLATLILALALALLPGETLSPAGVVAVTAVLMAWAALGQVFGLLGTRSNAWNIAAGIFIGSTCGCFGGLISYNLTTGSAELLTTLSGLGWTPAVLIVTAVSLILAAAGNLAAYALIRRTQVRF